MLYNIQEQGSGQMLQQQHPQHPQHPQQSPQDPPPHDVRNAACFNQTALSEGALAQMYFFFKHLEQRWSIKKRNDMYILKQKTGYKLTYTSECLSKWMTDAPNSVHELKQLQLMTFLHNALEGGWNIKKQSNASNTSGSYVFVKKHNGHYKMYEDDEYLTQFMKNNLSLES